MPMCDLGTEKNSQAYVPSCMERDGRLGALPYFSSALEGKQLKELSLHLCNLSILFNTRPSCAA